MGFEAVAITYNPEYIRIKIITLDIQKAIVTYTWVCESNQTQYLGPKIMQTKSSSFIKQFQTQLLYTLFDDDYKDSAQVINKGYEKALFLVTQAIDKIMTGEDIQQQDLVISKLLRQDIEKYRSLFPHVSAAIQLSQGGRSLAKGDNIEYIYTNSQHNNPLCRVVPLELVKEEEVQGQGIKQNLLNYDKEKYKEMILDAAETVLGIFGFDRTVYDGNFEKTKKERRRKKWYEELREERIKDIQTEMS